MEPQTESNTRPNPDGSISPLQSVVDFLKGHAPFGQMAPAHLEFLAKRLRLVFFAKGEIITHAKQGPAPQLFIIKQGRVRGEPPGGESGAAWELVAGESFPIGALLGRRPVYTVHRAVEDTFCFELDREDFEKLVAQSPVFHDFCTRRLASLLDEALRTAQASAAAKVSEGVSLSAPLADLIQREPVTCLPDAPLREALARLESEHVGSIVVVDGEARPLGIVTLHDVLSRVVLAEHSLDAPVEKIMTSEPLALPSGALSYEAALLMAQHGFGHVCVVDRGRLTGVVSERDLFSLQRVGLVNLSRAITRAPDVQTLKSLAGDVHRLVHQMLAQGASVEQLTQIITALNDHLTCQVIALSEAAVGKPQVPYTWLAFGSEGRYEQTISTDQDNGMLLAVPPGWAPEQARETLLPLARRINESLAEIGFPLCKGNIMASNPDCCLSLEEWQQRFERWIDQGTPEHLLNATIFFDLRPLYGDEQRAETLRAWLLERTRRNSRFRKQMAANALRLRPPLGLIRDFVVASGGKHPNTIDLKLNGVTPFVDAARIVALAHGIGATNTVARLEAAADAGALAPADVAAWAEAYYFIQLLRMRNHRRQAEQGEALSNHIDPETLNELDRRILKEAFRQARKLQSKLALEYQL
jgi:CBS domain-containing protein